MLLLRNLSRRLILCAALLALLISVCLAERAPSIHKNASIQWDDMHFQVKPDGIPMYLVSIHDVLIEGAKFSIQATDGSVHSNLLKVYKMSWKVMDISVDDYLAIRMVKVGCS